MTLKNTGAAAEGLPVGASIITIENNRICSVLIASSQKQWPPPHVGGILVRAGGDEQEGDEGVEHGESDEDYEDWKRGRGGGG